MFEFVNIEPLDKALIILYTVCESAPNKQRKRSILHQYYAKTTEEMINKAIIPSKFLRALP